MANHLIDIIQELDSVRDLCVNLKQYPTIELRSLSGSSFALTSAAVVSKSEGIHIFVMDDRDSAAYLCNDLYVMLDKECVFFFPTAYKRSIQFGQEDPSGIVQRTAAMNAIKNFSSGYLVICTYPEALVEKVVRLDRLRQTTLRLVSGENISMDSVEQLLLDGGFVKVDFVYEPGQYSLRGGIIDVFSYSDNNPFRLDFFGDTIESIRSFDISTQLSINRLDNIDIVPNLKRVDLAQSRVSFPVSVGAQASYWVSDLDNALKRFTSIRTKILGDLDEPSTIDNIVTGKKSFLEDTKDNKMYLWNNRSGDRPSDRVVEFDTAPQPRFNKNFELLAKDIREHNAAGYKTYILSENKLQLERLRNIFNSIGESGTKFHSLPLTLHQGFVSHQGKVCFYTDHQIFERYHRYSLRGEIRRSESLTIAELNTMHVGDFVVHIEHGVGRFGGLVRTVENGHTQEAIKLVYKDNDVLLVNVHSMHRIARYKDKDSEPPKIYKLGSGAWQRMKAATKKAVKDIARELIDLYARRKSSKGFAFSPDSYMQQEMEASFAYDETVDQQKAIEAVKHDMESTQPMDRLICGDVGFGKTEVAIRAAFKAVSDSKQVGILVPTTILSLQHYRTFSDRLRDFPVRIEHLSRAKSAADTRKILEDLRSGKIDILIGTHKILGKDVVFKSLGLLIIDEEQKFGVSSKEKLRQMSFDVDTLTLTATPIPRTLQFSLMGSRDLSVIATAPANRQPISTESHVFDEAIIKEAIDFEMARHGQVYFVHNRVDNIGKIETMIRRLCPGVRCVVGHGQMNPQQLEKIVMDFIYGEYDVLIATTIIENGIDIPNANTIIINNAHHFGLSDLHQLRGRVGRSDRKAFCYLFSPADEFLTSDARRRLRALEEFTDLGSGFNIAMQDLDIRGAGNLLGAQQSGFIADIGFETYQKILDEAMQELRSEGISSDSHDTDKGGDIDGSSYLSDCHIDIQSEAFMPDDYIGNSVEKIRLYRELDSIKDEESLLRFEQHLRDRFGILPAPTVELLHVIRLRWICIKLGFERVKIKNGLMILQFIANQSSSYYKTPLFMAVLKYVTAFDAKFVFRQSNNKLSLTVRTVKDVADGVAALTDLFEKVK